LTADLALVLLTDATMPTAVTYDEDKTQVHVNGGELSFDDEAHVCEIREA
jgi:hypothetical protein